MTSHVLKRSFPFFAGSRTRSPLGYRCRGTTAFSTLEQRSFAHTKPRMNTDLPEVSRLSLRSRSLSSHDGGVSLNQNDDQSQTSMGLKRERSAGWDLTGWDMDHHKKRPGPDAWNPDSINVCSSEAEDFDKVNEELRKHSGEPSKVNEVLANKPHFTKINGAPRGATRKMENGMKRQIEEIQQAILQGQVENGVCVGKWLVYGHRIALQPDGQRASAGTSNRTHPGSANDLETVHDPTLNDNNVGASEQQPNYQSKKTRNRRPARSRKRDEAKQAEAKQATLKDQPRGVVENGTTAQQIAGSMASAIKSNMPDIINSINSSQTPVSNGIDIEAGEQAALSQTPKVSETANGVGGKPKKTSKGLKAMLEGRAKAGLNVGPRKVDAQIPPQLNLAPTAMLSKDGKANPGISSAKTVGIEQITESAATSRKASKKQQKDDKPKVMPKSLKKMLEGRAKAGLSVGNYISDCSEQRDQTESGIFSSMEDYEHDTIMQEGPVGPSSGLNSAATFHTGQPEPLGSQQAIVGNIPQRYTPYKPLRFSTTLDLPSAAVSQNPSYPASQDISQLQTSHGVPGSQMANDPVSTGTATHAESPQAKFKLYKKGVRSPALIRSLLEMPMPTPAYLAQAATPPLPLSRPQRLLIVLDLNGTLLFRASRSTNVRQRPFLTEFLAYCFAEHNVLVWSSARATNVSMMCEKILTTAQAPLLFGPWSRSAFGLREADFNDDVQVYKRLEKVWDAEHIQRAHPGWRDGKRWGQHNTVLIDDSALKAAKQPYNHIEVPELVRNAEFNEGKVGVLRQVMEYLEHARMWGDVSAFMKGERLVIRGEGVPKTKSVEEAMQEAFV